MTLTFYMKVHPYPDEEMLRYENDQFIIVHENEAVAKGVQEMIERIVAKEGIDLSDVRAVLQTFNKGTRAGYLSPEMNEPIFDPDHPLVPE